MNKATKIYIANHQSTVGAALVRQLLKLGHPQAQLITRSPELLNLHNHAAVMAFIGDEQPDQIYLPIAHHVAHPGDNPKVNCASPGDNLSNLVHILSVIHAACLHQVGKLLLIGTPQVYPLATMSPMAEEDLLTGHLDPACESQGIAQITALKLCDSVRRASTSGPSQAPALDYRCLITATPYGPGESASGATDPSISSLIHRLHQAKLAGEPRVQWPFSGDVWTEYLHADDIARAATHLMNVPQVAYSHETQRGVSHINAGEGKACSASALANTLADIVGYTGDITFAPTATCVEPTLRRLDSHRMHQLGWYPALALQDGLALTYLDYLARAKKAHEAPGTRSAAATA